MLTSLLNRYTNWLTVSPFTSRMVTSGTLFFLGDTLCQTMMEGRGFGREKEWNYRRAARMTFLGTAFAGPVLYGWYSFGLPAIQGHAMFANWGKVPLTF